MPSDIIVLAMHGAPPRDLPHAVLAEFMELHARVEHGHGGEPGGSSVSAPLAPAILARAQELERRVKEWPRTAQNDPFWAASLELGRQLETTTGCRVLVGFNEFCAPDLETVFAEAASAFPARVVVVTPMLTKGGAHAEVDIPAAIARAQAAHPTVPFLYGWPFDTAAVVGLLADEVRRQLER